MTFKRAFTLFLCAVMAASIFLIPKYLKNNKIDYNQHYKSMEKDIKWRGVITIWDYPRLNFNTGSRYGWIRKKIREFEKNNPGVYIDFKELDWNSGPTLLKAAEKTGALPDIAPVGSDFYYISRGVLEELDGYISIEDKNDFLENVLETTVHNGKQYGLPWMMTGYTMLLNTNIFNDRGVALPEEGSWTYDQFLEAMKQLTYDNNNKGGPDIFGFNSFIAPGYYNCFGIILSDGAQIIDKDTGRYCFDYPEAVSGIKKLWELKHVHKVTHPEFGAMSESEAWTAFLKGKTAVYTAGSWAVPYLRTIQGNHDLSFAVANFPAGKAEIPVNIGAQVCSYAVFKQEDEYKRQKCVEFIKYLTSADKQGELVDYGYFPVRKSGQNLYINDKEMFLIQQSLKYFETLPKLYNWDDIDLVLQSRLKAAINNEITIEQAVQEMKFLAERYMDER
ncbi:MAG: ABC transporter substrate-binding protein [Bacillota bacterium]